MINIFKSYFICIILNHNISTYNDCPSVYYDFPPTPIHPLENYFRPKTDSFVTNHRISPLKMVTR